MVVIKIPWEIVENPTKCEVYFLSTAQKSKRLRFSRFSLSLIKAKMMLRGNMEYHNAQRNRKCGRKQKIKHRSRLYWWERAILSELFFLPDLLLFSCILSHTIIHIFSKCSFSGQFLVSYKLFFLFRFFPSLTHKSII